MRLFKHVRRRTTRSVRCRWRVDFLVLVGKVQAVHSGVDQELPLQNVLVAIDLLSLLKREASFDLRGLAKNCAVPRNLFVGAGGDLPYSLAAKIANREQVMANLSLS